jgi:hypothetical protein
MMLDDLGDADEIASELRRKGQDVTVREVNPKLG